MSPSRSVDTDETEDAASDEIKLQFQLREALRNNDLFTFEKAIKERKVDLEYVDSDGKTCLEMAVSIPNREQFVSALLKYGADVNNVNKTSAAAPIHLAVDNANIKALKTLLDDRFIDSNIMRKGNTPLLAAIKKMQKEKSTSKLRTYEEIVALLLKAGCNANTPDSRGMTPVAWAAKLKLENVVLIIAEKATEIDIDTYKDSDEHSARDYLNEVFPHLVSKFSAQPITGITDTKQLLFYYLNGDNEDEFIRLFRNIEAKNEHHSLLTADNGSDTMLQLATKKGLENVVEFLLSDRELNPNYTCRTTTKPIAIACQYGYYKILTLFSNLSSISFDPVEDESLLHITVKGMRSSTKNEKCNYEACLKLLLDNPKVNINQPDKKGNTALHYAARNGDHQTVLTLLRKGACVGLQNDFDIPPLADISAKTLETYLDECITTKGERPSDDDYEIHMKYSFLVYPNDSLQNEKELLIDHLNRRNVNSVLAPETDALLYMAKNEELRCLLKHPVITSFLYLKWQRICCLFYANIAFYFFLWLSLISYIILGYGVQTKQSASIEALNVITHVGAIVGLILLIFRELFQLLVSPMQYLQSIENWMEIALIFVTAWIVSYDTAVESTKQQLSAVAILLSSAELVLLFGQFPTWTTNIVMLRTVSWNFFKFLLWYCILIIAFALSFYTLFRHEDVKSEMSSNANTTNEEEEEDFFEDPARSLFKTIVMLTGEFDAGSIKFSTFPGTSHIIFIVFVFMIPIVLFNLLNGLAVSDTQEIRANAELVGHVSRVTLISYFENVLIGRANSYSKPSKCSSWLPSYVRAINTMKPKAFCMKLFAKRISLFPHVLPKYSIIVKPNQRNVIEIPNGETLRNFDDYEDIEGGNTTCCFERCQNYGLDRKTVKRAKVIIMRKGNVTELDEIKEQLKSMETVLKTVLQKLE